MKILEIFSHKIPLIEHVVGSFQTVMELSKQMKTRTRRAARLLPFIS